MDEDLILTEETDTSDGIDLDLSLDVLGTENVRSVTDAVDIPVFTDRFVMPERTPSITIAEVFVTNDISRRNLDVLSQDVLFQQQVIVGTTVVTLDEETTTTAFLILGFIFLGLITMVIMNFYLKAKKRKRDKDDFNI